MSTWPGYVVNAELGSVIGPSGKQVGRVRKHGYFKVRTVQGEVFLHRMVWQSVHGPIPDGLEINHINGDKADNRIANLELVTRRENIMHAFRTGLRTRPIGERNPKAKLSLADVQAIRASSESGPVLAARYGITRTQVNAIKRGDCWREAK